MARGNSSYFHYIHFIAKQQRGFTLLELVIAVSVMSIMLAMAAPSFSQLIETNKIKRLATEVEWLLVQAKSEAIMRGRNIYVSHLIGTGNQWCLVVSESATDSNTCIDLPNNVIGKVDSQNFKLATFSSVGGAKKFYYEPIYGKPKSFPANGHYSFSLGEYKFKTVLYSLTGRIYTCIVSPSNSSPTYKVGSYETC
ncbi:type IV pilin [Photobacterium leiognathi subsp. mandapamensis]|nr:type IV pilin [Photobacterium leiognathi subsp. mandapamensis]